MQKFAEKERQTKISSTTTSICSSRGSTHFAFEAFRFSALASDFGAKFDVTLRASFC